MKFRYISIVTLGLLTMTACNKVLDKNALNTLSPDQVFDDSILVQLNLDVLYEQNLPTWGGQNTSSTLSGMQSQYTEEGYTTSKNAVINGTITLGTSEPTDFGTANGTNNNYYKIRQLNTFIESLATSPLPSNTKRKFLGQALFFRAFRYWDLVRIYGGVPLVLSSLNGVGNDARDAALLPRNTTAECFKQIVADLDSAIAMLPGKWPVASTDWGRITSGGAAAFKGRALLYYASPLFNPSDLPERWQAAYDANVQAKTLLDANGYGLNSNYKTMWFAEAGNSEAVFVKVYNNATTADAKENNGYDNSTRPKYMGSSGGSNQPVWEMVKAYPMKDGLAPGTSPTYTYSDQTFYKNRDPRFDATIAYNGCLWPLNGNSAFRLWTYNESTSANSQTEAQAPYKSTPTGTGFYCRKAISESTFPNNDPQYCGTDWMEIRYAEVLLNLAEAAVGINRIGQAQEGYAGLIAVRKRAGIDAGTGSLYGLASGMTRSQLFDAILFERKIEFAYEGKRFWDLYRWKKVETTLNGWLRNKILIQLKSGSGIPSAATLRSVTATGAYYRDTMSLDNAYANYFTVTVNNDPLTSVTATTLESTTYNWQTSYYFFPIPLAAITNDPKLVQNNNWGGAFDPLQ